MSLKDLTKLVVNLTQEKSIEDKFLFELNTTISRYPSNYKPSKFYKPSSIGDCSRSIYYQRSGTPTDNLDDDPNLVGMCESGSARHVDIQTWVSRMKEMGYNCEWLDVAEYLKIHPVEGTRVIEHKGMETKCFNAKYQMSFLCDGLIRYENQVYILEIKTESLYKFTGQTEPYIHHERQVTCYSMCLGINKVIFIYENRNVCEKKAFLYVVTPDMKSEIKNRINEIETFLSINKVPPMCEDCIKSKTCTSYKYCNYKEQCRKDGEVA